MKTVEFLQAGSALSSKPTCVPSSTEEGLPYSGAPLRSPFIDTEAQSSESEKCTYQESPSDPGHTERQPSPPGGPRLTAASAVLTVATAAQACGHGSESWVPNTSLLPASQRRKAEWCQLPQLSVRWDGSGGRRRSARTRPHFLGPAARRELARSSPSGSCFLELNQWPVWMSGPQDPVTASVTSAVRDLCPRRKRKRAGPGVPTPCRGGPADTPSDFLQVHLHSGARRAGGRRGPELAEPGRRAGSRLRAGLGTARRRRPGAQWAPPGGQARGQRGPGRRSSGAARAPNAAAAWHRRAARPVHANGRRPRHELFSSGAERVSAARRATRAAHPPPLRSCRGDFPNFPGSAPRMRPPRRRRPRPRARRPRFPRCRLFYVFCLGVGTCPRERVSLPTPSPPDRSGGGGTGDPGRRGRGKRGSCGPCSLERPPEGGGRAREPGTPLHREVRAAAAPGIQRDRPRPPPYPLRGAGAAGRSSRPRLWSLGARWRRCWPWATRFLLRPLPGVRIGWAPGSGHWLECQGGHSVFSCLLRRGA
ncbi:translation initiation factor IF-2-like [Nycticebus coucang]|uniref:translation initiation factor IF-2-like n=1 Tax=Nycticebus coucang TaxID=9470 RepID=UPI00234D020C|nr:translation initiation factor IF-2-like [Nycticebus coucang]